METTETIEMEQPETEIREGYKKTKIGWIPEDWQVQRLGQAVTFLDGKRKPIKESDRLLMQGSYPYYGASGIIDFVNDYIFDDDLILLGEDGANILTRSTRLSFKVSGKCWVNNHAHVLKPKKRIDINFLNDFLESIDYRKYNTSIAQPKLNKAECENIKIAVPPFAEQIKIGKILTTWDAAIEQTQKLLEQLKLRKKGLMQQLLTGKTRLKGFDRDWKYLKGGELFSNHSNKNHDGTLTVLSATQDKGVIPRDETGIDIKYDRNSLKSYKKVEVGDFVISLRSFQGGIEYSNYEGLVSPAYTVLKEANPISKVFYKEYLKTDSFITRLNSIIYGIRDGKQISYKEFATLKIAYPALDEQQAIAKVLTAADAEIKTQETYLDKLQIQKRGLMQKLLTGEIRVNVENVN